MMHKFKKYNTLYIFILVLIFSCSEKLVNDENLSPKIQFVNISSNKLVQFKDSLSIVIHYEDGDGDLGDIHPDSLSLFVRDFRLNSPDKYHLIPLSQNNAKIKIGGDLSINLKNIFLLSPSPSETTNFEIKLKDRSNHWSNVVFTPKIEIIR